MTGMALRQMTLEDATEVAELIYASINVWYRDNGHSEIQFQGGPGITEVFFETYDALEPGSTVVAVNPASGRIMGSCFYHPRSTHVGLGIMNVHPNYFGLGVAKALMQHICDYTDSNGHSALRLTSSALNLDSYALYTKHGFVPRLAYQDMWVAVPEGGLGASFPGRDRVRPATPADAPLMEALELEVSGVSRGPDYSHAIENVQGFWGAAVLEAAAGGIDGYMISSGHAAMNIIGPLVARTEDDAIALVAHALDLYPGRTPLVLVPVERRTIVEQMYAWGARISELHFCQVRGEFQPFRGVSMPTFMLETA
ncbi:MAG: GNAT family N-acetyltransferase [Gaiella sp.]